MRETQVVLLMGPTAVGKTELSIHLAKSTGAEIVSVDSRLLYRGMDIGTAKPTPAQQSQVAHHLIDVADPNDRWSLTRYLAATKAAIDQIHAAGKLPLLVGGTGQYFAALVEGWQPPPRADDRKYRERMRHLVEAEGAAALHTKLQKIDPASAERIDPRNIRRVIRALEIHHVTGQSASDQRRKVPPPYDFLMLGLKRQREELYERIDARIERMITSGWIEEVQYLLKLEVDIDAPALSAIGYRQIAEYLQGEIDLDAAVRETKRLTRQFVRRQENWFRRFEPELHWFEPERDALERMTSLVQAWRVA